MQQEIDVLARTLYGEARGEYKTIGIAAFIAIGNVVINRLKFPKFFGTNVQEICLKPYQFSCWLENDPNYFLIQKVTENDPLFSICWEVAHSCIEKKYPDLTQKSDHYHHFVSEIPYWAKHKVPKIILGRHFFYQLHSTIDL